MIEPAIVLVRLLQYAGAAILLGSSLFFVCLVPGSVPAQTARWARRTIMAAAAILALSSLVAIALQGSLFGATLADGFTPDAFVAIVSSMALGKAAIVRTAAAAAAFLLLAQPRPAGRLGLLPAASLGAIATASMAWMGHGADSQSWFHLAADMLHALTAAVWIGALAGFLLLLGSAREAADLQRLQVALGRFSAVGVPLVLVLALSGLANMGYVIGLDHVGQIPFTPYGRLLLAKLAAFAAMLGLAALNRYRLTPALEAERSRAARGSLRRSILLEAALGFAVLALVAWLGTLEPFM